MTVAELIDLLKSHHQDRRVVIRADNIGYENSLVDIEIIQPIPIRINKTSGWYAECSEADKDETALFIMMR